MKKLLLALLLITLSSVGRAQSAPPFWNDIKAFKKEDSLRPPPQSPILFIGSSSFTRWKELQDAFPGYPVLNRAFGGSTLPDLSRYFYDIVLPYRPRQILIYCGENDLASADSISASEVLRRVKALYFMIRTQLPQTQISYVSIKPSPVRSAIQPKVLSANKAIRAFFRKQKNAAFIDVYGAMLDSGGHMREELYVADRLHMKPEGYAIWQRIILPYLRAR